MFKHNLKYCVGGPISVILLDLGYTNLSVLWVIYIHVWKNIHQMAMKKNLGCKCHQTLNLYVAILSYFGSLNPVHYSKVKKQTKTKRKTRMYQMWKLAICLSLSLVPGRMGFVILIDSRL